MTPNISVVKSNIISSHKSRHKSDWIQQYDLTISCNNVTVFYIVRTLKDEMIFLRVDKILPSSNKRNISFDSLDVRIREDFYRTVYPSISEEDLLCKLHGPEIAKFLIDKKHFVYSKEITLELMNHIGKFKKVVFLKDKTDKIEASDNHEEHRAYLIDDTWFITLVVKDGLISKKAYILDIIHEES